MWCASALMHRTGIASSRSTQCSTVTSPLLTIGVTGHFSACGMTAGLRGGVGWLPFFDDALPAEPGALFRGLEVKRKGGWLMVAMNNDVKLPTGRGREGRSGRGGGEQARSKDRTRFAGSLSLWRGGARVTRF